MNAVAVRAPFEEPTFSSLDQAVSFAARPHIRSENAERDTKIIQGSRIIGASSTQTSLHLSLSNNMHLTFYLMNRCVNWSIASVYGKNESECVSLAPMVLRFVNSGIEYCWDKNQLIQVRLNQIVQKIWAGVACAYLYVENCPLLLLNRLIIDGTDDEMLFWATSD